MADRIFVENLHLRCRIGVTEEERRDPQEVVVDASVYLDLSLAGRSNDLRDTIDYKKYVESITGLVEAGPFVLLEGLAAGIATMSMGWGADRVVVRVRKGKYSSEPSIGVEIERTRE